MIVDERQEGSMALTLDLRKYMSKPTAASPLSVRTPKVSTTAGTNIPNTRKMHG